MKKYLTDAEFIGQKFNHLTVIEKGPAYVSPTGHTNSQWYCECDCPQHTKILVRRNNLLSGNTKSCGCQNTKSRQKNIKKAAEKSKLDLAQKRFGYVVALEPTNERINNSVAWKCKCDCGHEFLAAANQINAGRIISCGCTVASKGNLFIAQILLDNDIYFEKEKTFETCRFPDTNEKARFDFYVDNKFLVEFDGIQHFQERDITFFRDSLQVRQEHDRYKNEWCKENNIVLKRIPYTKLGKITLEDIMGEEFIVK